MSKYGRERSYLPRVLPKFPAIKDGNTLAEDFDGKVSALRKAFFPSPRPAKLDDIESTAYPMPLETEEIITPEEIN